MHQFITLVVYFKSLEMGEIQDYYLNISQI
jgi:hypothetical protein